MGLLTDINIYTIFWLIILPIPLGYLFKIIKTSFNGFDELPDFENWKSIYLDGIKLIAVAIIYALPVVILILLINYAQISLVISNISLINLLPLLIGPQILLLIAIGLIEYMAIANMALYDGELSAAFNFKAIIGRISKIGWKEYLIYYIIVWILLIITVLTSYLALILIIGIVVIPLVIAPYYMIVITRLLALIFASSEKKDN